MRNNVFLMIVPIFVVIVCLVLNFQEFLMGSPATAKNLIVTLVYFAIWIFIFILAVKSGNHKLLKYYSAFWLLTLLFAIITGFVNVTGLNANWAIPFVILFLTQWYGVELLVDHFLITSIIIATLSLMMCIATLFFFKKSKFVS